MKTIKIFLASSLELKEERREFEIFIGRKNKEYNKQEKEIYLELVIWEDFIDAVSKTRLQDEYNKAICECDIFVSLFFTKVGKYTNEEFETAFEHFHESGKPLIYTYFKNSNIKTDEITDEIRLKGYKTRDLIMEIASAIHNFRLKFRPWNYPDAKKILQS